MTLRLVLGLVMTAVALAFAVRRVHWLARLVRSGQPTTGRTEDLGARVRAHLIEVFGQAKLLRWTIPGAAHFLTFWGFLVLATVYLEAYGALFDADFHIPLVGTWAVLGFLQDLFAMAVLLGIVTFAVLRIRQGPRRPERWSRFYGSHLGGAWLILFMIFNVIWTYLVFRGAAVNTGHFPYAGGAFASELAGAALHPLGEGTNEVLENVGLLLHLGVMLAFLVILLYSKHLHIATAPINVTTKRLPDGLGALLPMESRGKPIDFEDPGEDDIFGRGKVEDFTWKGMLDFATCTECGRCQSQCPAWNTGKPLSPKLVIMDLRDHLFAKAPYILGDKEIPADVDVLSAVGESNGNHAVPEAGYPRITGSGPAQAARPLVGTAEQGGVIDPDVLWSCTTCGACVDQCPVDIEHVDHIVDMRRYQVLIESEFPTELGGLFKNLENKGNPWGQNARDRLAWTDGLPFDVPVFDGSLGDDVEYLFWVGCAGAFDDGPRRTTRAVAELLHIADVRYVVLGPEETCSGDPARRSGNEFLFQMLAQQNVEVLNTVFENRPAGKRKIVVTCPHCFNTIGNEYPQLGGHFEVVHHTQLLNRLVRERRLVPVSPVAEDVTYHDPCYLGRHNKVYSPPRELISASGAALREMPRHADRALCCGAGGARMWMEERIGKRINHERIDEALSTAPTKVATGCPFCRVMLTDGLTDRKNSGDAAESVEIADVAQLLLTAVKRGPNGAGAGAGEPGVDGAGVAPPPATTVAGDTPESGTEQTKLDTVD